MIVVEINRRKYSVRFFSGTEVLSYGYDFDIVFESNEELGNLCGMEIIVDQFIIGIIDKIRVERNGHSYLYSCHFCSYIQYYCKYKVCRIFKNISLKQLISSLLKLDAKFLFITNHHYDYFIQYKTSTHDIVNYLCHIHGLAYYCIGRSIYFVDSALNMADIIKLYYSQSYQIGRLDTHYINEWKIEYRDQVHLNISSLDQRNPSIDISDIFAENSDFDYRADLSSRELKEKYKKSINSKPNKVYLAKTYNSLIHVGSKVEIDENYFVYKVNHSYDINNDIRYDNNGKLISIDDFIPGKDIGYNNDVELISIDDFIPAAYVDINCAMPQNAKIVNSDRAHNGILSVKFHWSDAYIDLPVLQSIAGNGYGSLFMPRIGEYVLVGFESNNPLNPFVYGSFYNKANISSFNSKEQSGIKIDKNEAIIDNKGFLIKAPNIQKQVYETYKIINNDIVIELSDNAARLNISAKTSIDITQDKITLNIKNGTLYINANNIEVAADTFNINTSSFTLKTNAANINASHVSINSNSTSISALTGTSITSPTISLLGVVIKSPV